MFEGKRNQDRERRSRRWLTERCDRYRDENRGFRIQIAVLWLLVIILGLAFCGLVPTLLMYKKDAAFWESYNTSTVNVEGTVSINWDSYAVEPFPGYTTYHPEPYMYVHTLHSQEHAQVEFVDLVSDEQFEEWYGADPTAVAMGGHMYRVTCYSPVEGFRETNPVCRGGSVREWVDRATEQGLGGICAAGGQTPWYRDAKHADPPLVLEIEGHGRYLLVDRAAERLGIIDIWVPDLGEMWNHYCRVTVVE